MKWHLFSFLILFFHTFPSFLDHYCQKFINYICFNKGSSIALLLFCYTLGFYLVNFFSDICSYLLSTFSEYTLVGLLKSFLLGNNLGEKKTPASIKCNLMNLVFEYFVAVVQSPSCVWLFTTSRTVACQTSLSLTIFQSLPKFKSAESVMSFNYHILCRPLLLLPSIFLNIRFFANELALPIIWPKYWNFSFSNSLSKEYLGLISFKIDWFDLLALQGTLRSLLQHHSWNTPINELKYTY